ncbi:Pathogenesis-related protein 5 [Colletotrichum fructicola]|nr:Pathogenesis-related protein 5 [Colletotrichum fructicola]
MMFVFLIFATTLHAQSVVLTIVNNSSDHTIWPAIEGSPLSEPTLSDGGVVSGDPLPEGLALLANSTVKVALPQTNWSGRLWARQYCSADGTGCVLGDCGSRSCWGRSSTLTTLFELTVLSDKIYYDISLVDGYTCGITVKPDDDACEPITYRWRSDWLGEFDASRCRASNPWFKKTCPTAYSFAYDDRDATFTCGLRNMTIYFDCGDSVPQ